MGSGAAAGSLPGSAAGCGGGAWLHAAEPDSPALLGFVQATRLLTLARLGLFIVKNLTRKLALAVVISKKTGWLPSLVEYEGREERELEEAPAVFHD